MGDCSLQCIRIDLAVGRGEFGCPSCCMRQGVRTCFEGPGAIVEMAHETMLAFGEMVDRRECNTLDEQLLHFVDHSGDVRSVSERDPSGCIDALHAHQPIYVGNGISLGSPDRRHRRHSICASSPDRCPADDRCLRRNRGCILANRTDVGGEIYLCLFTISQKLQAS